MLPKNASILITELKNIEIDKLTPLEAMNKLAELKKLSKPLMP